MDSFLTAVLAPLMFVLLLMANKWLLSMPRNPTRIITDSQGRKKISLNPWIFGSETSRDQFFYKDNVLYKIKGNSTVTIDFSDIIEIKPGFTKISNRRSVVLVYLLYGQKKEVYFYPNLTFFNHNFAQFLIEVKQANPDADVKSLSRLSR